MSPQRPPEKCRYAVGSILCEGEEKPDEELQKMYEKFGFKVFSLPEVSHAVTTAFPCSTSLSYVLGPYRVYPKLSSYIEVRGPAQYWYRGGRLKHLGNTSFIVFLYFYSIITAKL